MIVFLFVLGAADVVRTEAEETDRPARQPDVAKESSPAETPLSTIVEIQNHGERFFDTTDEATDLLNRIGMRDDVWDAARAAKEHADANPDDPQAQADYRAARGRFYHHRVQMLREALGLQSELLDTFEAFTKQLDIEITAVQRQVAAEQEVARQHMITQGEYQSHLQQLNEQVEQAEDLDPEALDVLKDVQRVVRNTEYQQVLAEERELLAIESLNDLRETQIYARRTYGELQDEFQQARSDLRLLEAIARNDLAIVDSDKRKAVLQRYQQRRPINSSQNRQVVADIMDAIRKRQQSSSERERVPQDGSLAEDQTRVLAYLRSLSPVDAAAPKHSPDESELPRDESND